jgi:hypothetical protein
VSDGKRFRCIIATSGSSAFLRAIACGSKNTR